MAAVAGQIQFRDAARHLLFPAQCIQGICRLDHYLGGGISKHYPCCSLLLNLTAVPEVSLAQPILNRDQVLSPQLLADEGIIRNPTTHPSSPFISRLHLIARTDYTRKCVYIPRFLPKLRYWHGDICLYHIMCDKRSPPRVAGYMPASGHWRFRGTMTPSHSEQAAPLATGRWLPVVSARCLEALGCLL